MKTIGYIALFLILAASAGCKVESTTEEVVMPVTTGVLEIDFKLPYIPLPKKNIHLVDLSIARTADSLYRGLFISSANVIDSKNIYHFVLTPGTYYYQAGITCDCLADSCLWGGFPGGRYGIRWAIDKVDVLLGKVIRESPSFQ